jgi:hypothetical protein
MIPSGFALGLIGRAPLHGEERASCGGWHAGLVTRGSLRSPVAQFVRPDGRRGEGRGGKETGDGWVLVGVGWWTLCFLMHEEILPCRPLFRLRCLPRSIPRRGK